MGLKPLEFLDCYLDSPAFREILLSYEKELENDSSLVKNLTKECHRMIQATKEFSKVQQSFANNIKNIKYEMVGEECTQEEVMIAESLKIFADVLLIIEEQRCTMLSNISAHMLDTLERFHKDSMQQVKDEKRRFEKCSEKYYNTLEKSLSLNQRRKDTQAQHEIDSALLRDRAAFQQVSFQYACQLQDIHAVKQYEITDPILSYIGDITTFLHQAYDKALSTRPLLEKTQFRIQMLRETHKEEQEKAYELKAKIIQDGKQGLLYHPEFIKQGFLMVQEKRIGGLTHSWIRYFCQFSRTEDVQFLRLIPLSQNSKPEFYRVKQCARCKSDEPDRRFCIEMEMYIHRGDTKKYFMQAMSPAEMKEWLEVMENQEPSESDTSPAPKIAEVNMLTQIGYDFIRKCTQTLEKRGLKEEDIYRKPGPKAVPLMKDCIERGKLSKVSLDDENEYDTKTIAGAVKLYFSKQISEPLMTYALYDLLIDAAKLPYYGRIAAITNLVNKLPSLNYKVLSDFITHLSVVACHSNYNLMQASNLGVVFGPVLMRPEVETVATINNIKYQNIIVEMMIDEKDKILNDNGPPEIPQETSQDISYDKLEGAPVTSPSNLLRPTSEDNLVGSLLSKSTTLPSHNPHIKPKVNESPTHNQFESKPTYAVPSKKPPRPTHNAKKRAIRSRTVDCIPIPIIASEPMDKSDNRTTDDVPPIPWRSKSLRKARTLYDCESDDPIELNFKKGEILVDVKPSEEPGWLQAKLNDRTGLVPKNYIQLLS